MTSLLRVSAFRERLRASLWTWPAITVAVAVAAGLALPLLESRSGTVAIGFSGTPEGARAVLATVAGSTITVTGLTFSLTVVALQVASSQFTPRLLATFLSDRGNQAVLSVFLGTFVYTLAVLRSVRSATEATDPFVPDVAVVVGLLLTLVSVGMLVYFFHHLTEQLRVESVLNEIQQETLALVRRQLPTTEETTAPAAPPAVPDDAIVLRALRSGQLQALDGNILARAAITHEAVLRLRPVVGTHVTQGTTLAWAWPINGHLKSDIDVDELTSRIHDGIHLGRDRTLQQDIAFGVRQLVDIAARALSPGVNDPTTAITSLTMLSGILVELAQRRLDPIVGHDDEGRPRAIAMQPTFSDILALACDQPRRYGASEPAVLIELVHMLTDIAETTTDDEARGAVDRQVEETLRVAEMAELSDAERRRVRFLARHARVTLQRQSRVASIDADAEADTPAS